MMQESTLVELEKLFLALSDKTRLRLLSLMADGEVPVGYLADKLGESQPKISRHLAYLRTAGLVSTRRDGKWIYYAIDDQENITVKRVIDATLGSARSYLPPSHHPGDAYVPYDESYISDETYMSDWTPNELEVYLL
jgi:DNA-binding transcriptional ArsR family regulator